MLPRDTTIRGRYVWITTHGGGLVIRRRTGLSSWTPVCSLPWADIEAMEIDTRMLYASTRSSWVRKPLIDRAHLSPEQWVLLRDSVAEWTGQIVWIDLA